MTTRPPVTDLVLYKHGVAFVGRRGPIDDEFTLRFRRDDMSDVLKSLYIDAAGAAVGAVTFETPADIDAEPTGMHAGGSALADLVDGLRGRSIEVRCGADRHRGQVIGLDDSGGASGFPGTGAGGFRRNLLLRIDSGEIALVDLTEATGLSLLEAPSHDDLAALIDRSRAATAGANCDVAVQVRGRSDDARISYLVAAPRWRISYRLIRDGDAATLVAMGIIHNPLDEDLADVAVTLTTGQPVSFDIDLYHARRVRRSVVEEEDEEWERTGAAPVPRMGVMAAPASASAYADAVEEVAAEDRGEYFEYRLTTPVALNRGGAAMVPLAVAQLDSVRRELVWRNESGPSPEIALAFVNTSGLVLEEGPTVIYDIDGAENAETAESYAGEAMLDFTARGAAVRLSFARDLAVRCRQDTTTESVTVRVRLAAEAVVEEQRLERRHVLRAENDHDEPVEVVFELARYRGHTVSVESGATGATDATDADRHRFAVTAPAHQVVEAVVLETRPVYNRIAYQDLAPGQLERWLAGRSVDADTIEVLSGVLGQWERATRADAEREEMADERADVQAAQSGLAEQLRVLGTDGAEGELRRRQVGELAALQDRAGGLDARMHALRAEAADARAAAAAELQRVIGSVD